MNPDSIIALSLIVIIIVIVRLLVIELHSMTVERIPVWSKWREKT